MKDYVLNQSDLGDFRDDCGMTVHDGVIVFYDYPEKLEQVMTGDGHYRDLRVFIFIDSLQPTVRKKLIAAQAHKGTISLIWKDAVPLGFEQSETIPFVNLKNNMIEDFWLIYHSSAIKETVIF